MELRDDFWSVAYQINWPAGESAASEEEGREHCSRLAQPAYFQGKFEFLAWGMACSSWSHNLTYLKRARFSTIGNGCPELIP